MTDLRSTLAHAAYLPKTLRLVWAAAKGWNIVWALLLVLQGLLPIASIYLTGLLVDRLTAAIAEGSTLLSPTLLIPAVLMGVVLLLTEGLQVASEWVRAAQAELVKDHISGLVHAKSASIDLAFYESPDYYDHLHQARDEASNRPLALLEHVGGLIQDGVTAIALAALLLPYGVWLPLLLAASTLPALYVVLDCNRRYHRWWQRTTADQRWAAYYDAMLINSEPAAELRLFGLGSHFQAAYQTLRKRLRGEQLQLARAQGASQLAAAAGVLLVSAGAVGWMVWRTLQGAATLGDLVRFYQAFERGQHVARALLSNLGSIYANGLFLNHLYDFLALEPRVTDPPDATPMPVSLRQGISFHNVSFAYPGSERTALHQFNLTIPAGKIVAIVGDNGAGKSTLTKLLCRFYDPSEGRIELDGVDIRRFSVEDLRRAITVLFQMPVPYHASAGHNIAIGDLAGRPDADAIERAARGAGAHEILMRLPQGYDTLLGKWFADGTELSGGEWQRVALARAFLRQSPIMILDEPTSFMDSWAEAEWLDRFRALVAERTALVITHRFTTAMRADYIYVMRQGQIVEAGSHEQLVAQGGAYARSWNAQTHHQPSLFDLQPTAGVLPS